MIKVGQVRLTESASWRKIPIALIDPVTGVLTVTARLQQLSKVTRRFDSISVSNRGWELRFNADGMPVNGAAMLDPSSPSPIWVVWPYLSWLERLLFVALIVLGVYICSSAAITISRVRKTVASLRNGGSLDAKTVFAALHKRSARVERLITTAFYLFGMVLFLGLQGAYFIVDNSKATVERIIIRDFQAHFAFAANVFFVLLVLHIIGWFISRCARQSCRSCYPPS